MKIMVKKLGLRLSDPSKSSTIIAFTVIFAVMGVLLLFLVRAATPTVSLEVESATLSGNASLINDSTASGAQAIRFNNQTSTPPPTYPAALWHANADTDTSADNSTETNYWKKEVTSSIWSRLRIVNDPLGQYGKVYYANITAADIAAGNKRAEWRGAYNGSGGNADNQIKFAESQNLPQNLYMGWRSLFGPDLALNNNENDGNFMQLKGDSSCGGPAVGITVRYNRLSIRAIDGDYLAWDGPLMTTLMNNQWHSFVLHVNFSKDASTGYVELWLDGQPQTMANGQTRIYVPTVCPNDTHVFPKFGTYGMDVGKGVGPEHWVESPRIGTSYQSVVPR
jgi:hypothetical protein